MFLLLVVLISVNPEKIFHMLCCRDYAQFILPSVPLGSLRAPELAEVSLIPFLFPVLVFLSVP